SFLKDLKGLTSLGLSSNQISDIKPLLPLLKKGRKISTEEYAGDIRLYNNPVKSPPEHILQLGNDAVIRYFEALERESVTEVQLLEAKVLLLGEGKTGKTSLRIKIEDENKGLPEEEDRTRGIDIYNYKFPTQNDTFMCHIWDFGGQDVLYQVHRFFLSDDALYILVTDSRADQGNKYEEWLQTIEIFTHKDDNQIILLQNLKFGDTPANIDIADYKKYYTIVGSKVFEVDLSFSEKRHLDEFKAFKKVMEHRLLELPHVQKTILSDWLDVRIALEKLLETNTHLITLSQYTKICKQYNVENKDRQKDLLRYLHSLGIVLWYEEYPAIKQKVILNPEWVTTALYRIIDSQTIRSKNGKLEQEDIENLWNEAIYEDYHNELLEILRIFRLAYKRKQEHSYIVPSLMSSTIPTRYDNWDSEGKWLIKYKYTRLMPRGIVNQLAAELCKYVDSDFEDVWAFGVVFTTRNAQAKAQVNRSMKQIVIEAHGNERLTLMQAIVKAMSDIHDTYKGLEFEIEIPCVCEKCETRLSANKKYHKYYEDIKLEIDDNQDEIYCRNLKRTLKIAPILKRSGFALPYKLVELLRKTDASYQRQEIHRNSILENIQEGVHRNSKANEKILRNTEEIKSDLNEHFEQLLRLETNAKLNKDEVVKAVQEISITQREAVFNDIQIVLEGLYDAMDAQLKEYFDALNTESNNLEMKIKASVPLLNLVGLDIGVEGDFDIKSWSEKMYKKYEIQLFKLFGYL
ncbi:COR domain-containing protein, partial [Kordia sp.]|uniref:COR domain-containing protein n=1 Tax=Kordia sp. TaxID=1965332 RepID=UPI003D6A886D